jgi:hypothetical protein
MGGKRCCRTPANQQKTPNVEKVLSSVQLVLPGVRIQASSKNQ